MSIRLLRTLVAIADTKTFSEAADVVHVTHAAVSQQMRTLESDLGFVLFDRSSRTPELTPVAHQVVLRARKIIQDYDNLSLSALANDALSGVISLGALRTTLTGLTPQAVVVLRANFPQIGLHIRPGLTDTLLTETKRGTIDAAIIAKPHYMPGDIIFREIVQEPMQLIASVEEPENDPIKLLRERPFIRFDRNAVVGALIDNWILSKKIHVHETMELDSPEAITSMVHANLGVSIMPNLVIKPPSSIPVKHLDLGLGAPKRVLGLVYLKDQIKKQAIDELYEAILTVIKT